MSSLSVFSANLFVTCANPIFPLSDPDTGTFTFEVLEADAVMLKARVGKWEQYLLGEKPPFFGELVKLEPCESTHLGLLLLRDKPTLRGVLAVGGVAPQPGPNVSALHLGDIVEEISTKRCGKIDNMSITHGPAGQQTVNYWRVFFTDGKQPLLGIIKDASELRLVSCPHAESEPGFTPGRSIMGS